MKIHRMVESNISSWLKQLDDPISLKKRPRENKPYITISRESGAYGTSIGEMLVKYLAERERRRDAVWAMFDKEIINKVIDEHKFPEKYEKYLDESAMSTFQNIMGEIMGAHPSHETLVKKTSETIYNLARVGYVVIIGRGGNIITRSISKGVHVRLVSSIEKRIDHMKGYLNVSEREARDFIIKEDRDRSNYIKKNFHKDIDDIYLYDLVINLDNVPLEYVVKIIGEMVLKGKVKAPTHSP